MSGSPLIGRTTRAAMLFVVHLVEAEDEVLIFPARPTTKEERMRYEARLY